LRVDVLTSLYPGPTKPFEGIFAERRWRGVAGRGHDVRVLQPLPWAPPLAGLLGRGAEAAALRGMPAREERAGIAVERPRYLHLPGRALPNARRFAQAGLARVDARSPRADVVVLDYAWPASAAVPGLVRRGIPCVVSGRGSDVLQVAGEAGLGDELAGHLRGAGHWCAVSADLVRAMDELAGEPRGRLVPNGVDTELFAPRERGAARRRLALAEGPALVLVAGHLIERKDPLLALEVFRRGAPEDALCAFVGRGPLAGALAARVAELGLAERVRLVGEARPEELARWYAACDLLLLTSKREGRPNVVLEALASGRPVLATEAGGTGELLEGFPEMLVRGRDPAELAERLAALLALGADGAPGGGPGAGDRPSGSRESRDPARTPEALRAAVAAHTWTASQDALEELLGEAVGATRGAVPAR